MVFSKVTAVRAAATPVELADAPSDHDLMASMALGEARALDTLMERHLKSMLAVSYRILGNPADADEVTQEAFLRLWSYAPRWDADGAASVKTWLARVVTNLCIDRCRRHKPLPLDEAAEIIDAAPGGFEKAEAEGKKRLVQALISNLPERQRAAVVLSYFEEMSGAQMADAMGLSIGAVESLLVRARRALRAMMEKSDFRIREDL